MTRTTNEQREQVDRYVEIIHAQQDLAATRTEFIKITSWGAVAGFLISLLSLGLAFADDNPSRVFVWLGLSLFGSVLGPLTTGLLGFLRLGVRARRASERLSSLERDDDLPESLHVDRRSDGLRSGEGPAA